MKSSIEVMQQEDIPFGPSSLYIKCSSTEFWWQLVSSSNTHFLFATGLSNTSKVLEHFSVLRGMPMFYLPALSLLTCPLREVVCVCAWVRACVCVPSWQCSSRILQNATYHFGSCFFYQYVTQAGVTFMCVCHKYSPCVVHPDTVPRFPQMFPALLPRWEMNREPHRYTLHWSAVMVKLNCSLGNEFQ